MTPRSPLAIVLPAVMGPATPAPGVRESMTVTASRMAATVAALLGEDFRAAAPPLSSAR